MEDGHGRSGRHHEREGGCEVELLLILAVLVCPIVMGGMMFWMMLQMRRGARAGDPPRQDESG